MAITMANTYSLGITLSTATPAKQMIDSQNPPPRKAGTIV